MLLQEGAMDECILKALKSMKDELRGLIICTHANMMNDYLDMMRDKVALCNQITKPRYTHVRITMVTEIPGQIHRELKHILFKELNVRSTSSIYEKVGNNLFKILIAKTPAVEKELPKEWIIVMVQGVHVFM